MTCRAIDARVALVRLALENGLLVVDRAGTMPGRGGWIHARAACVDKLGGPGRGGLARSLRHTVTNGEIATVVAALRELCVNFSASDDIARRSDRRADFAAGQPGEEAVDMAPRINAKDLRSEDARL